MTNYRGMKRTELEDICYYFYFLQVCYCGCFLEFYYWVCFLEYLAIDDIVMQLQVPTKWRLAAVAFIKIKGVIWDAWS